MNERGESNIEKRQDQKVTGHVFDNFFIMRNDYSSSGTGS